MAKNDLTAQRVREVLHYDPLTGVFTRTARLAQRHQVGDRADWLVKNAGNLRGYRMVGLDTHCYLAHRVAWLYVHGSWPVHEIDHINGERGDNRIANLRDVVTRVNAQNKSKPRSDSVSGYLGVHYYPQRKSRHWRARIRLKDKTLCLGFFDDPAAAHEAYLAAKRRLHEGCTV